MQFVPGMTRLLAGWLFVSCSAVCVGQSPANLLGLPPKAISNQGSLVICGGKPDDPIFDEFVKLAGGRNARIVLVPSAYPYDGPEHLARAFGGWRSYGLESFTFLDAESRVEADAKEFCEPLERATGVWFSGGDQARLMRLYGGTKAETAFRKVFERGGTIGGTSAGAAVMSRVMIADGSRHEAVLDRGLGFVTRAVVDQHFSERGRFGRLFRVLDEYPELVGIGIDEPAALVVQGNSMRVIGEGRVSICLPQDSAATIVVHRLKPNEQADLRFDANHSPRLTLRRSE